MATPDPTSQSRTPMPAQVPPHPASMPSRAPPRFQLHKDRHTSTIKIDEWTITATKKPILNIQEMDSWEKSLGLPLPEMTFGNNSLELIYDPSSSSSSPPFNHRVESSDSPVETVPPASAPAPAQSSVPSSNEAGPSTPHPGVILKFHAYDALSAVAVGEGWEERVGGGVRVSMADKWGKNRSNPSALLTDVPLPTSPVKPHDWTFSSIHPGSTSGPSQFEPSTTHEIPMTLLARQDPVLDQILYYEDVPLFEDELHDNGESILNARIRVMPHSFFILARLFLRVDNVLFRMYDVRIYHSFGSAEVIRELDPIVPPIRKLIDKMLDKPSDLSPLTDPNFVSRAMAQLASRPLRPPEHERESDRRQGRSEKPWPGLGKKVEVLHLPSEVDTVGQRLGAVRV